MTEIKRYRVTEPYIPDLRCQLGEAPFWDRTRNQLRFVDMRMNKIHTVNLSAGPLSHQEHTLDFCVSATADIDGNDGEFIFAGKYGYGMMHKDTGTTRWLQRFWTDDERRDDGGGKPGVGRNKEERMRSNDGAVDVNGRFWVGTMNDDVMVGTNFTDEGVVFRLDPDLQLHRVKEGVTIPNGTSWTRDGRTMYFTDSSQHTVMAYPYDPDTGVASWRGGREFFRVDGGVPDGHCQDEEGCLWVACHGKGKVVRVNPQGRIVAEVELPTRCVTCPAFVGTELVVTSMWEVEPETFPESAKRGGEIYKVDVGVRGRPLNKFRMTG